MFWTHLTIILAFLNFLPLGKHFHVITGLPNVFFQKLDGSKVLSTPESRKRGVRPRTVRDLTWKHGLDLYSCTECGRCQTHCPTYVTGKPLTHKGVNQDLKHWIWDHQEQVANDRIAPGTDAPLPPIIGSALKAETVWACTTCGWCERACPVFIENVPRLIDMRRYKVQVEADFPPEIQRVFEGMERQGNPWGVAPGPARRVGGGPGAPGLGRPGKYEYLFFVGCAGSYDDRQKKVSRALVRILREAKVSFATLGKQEMCNGDSARRLGNEYLYQTLAKTNVETFNGLGVKAVITQCPHCFNTIKNEYPEFGGQLPGHQPHRADQRAHPDKRIKLSRVMDETLTYHDPCYLGPAQRRVRRAPRGAGGDPRPQGRRDAAQQARVVLLRRRRRADVDGGAHRHAHQPEPDQRGGAHARPRQGSVHSLSLGHRQGSTGQGRRLPGPRRQGTVAVACPFCSTMLRDAANETGREGMVVKDVAELVAESMEGTAAQ